MKLKRQMFEHFYKFMNSKKPQGLLKQFFFSFTNKLHNCFYPYAHEIKTLKYFTSRTSNKTVVYTKNRTTTNISCANKILTKMLPRVLEPLFFQRTSYNLLATM